MAPQVHRRKIRKIKIEVPGSPAGELEAELCLLCGRFMDTKIGITIGYSLDLIGFLVLYFSGAFDSKYKSSRAALETLIAEKEFLKKTLKNLQTFRSMTVSRDHITGAPNIGTSFADPNSLADLQREISEKDELIQDFQNKHSQAFRYYLLVFDKAPLVGVIFVLGGIVMQWWFSSYGVKPL